MFGTLIFFPDLVLLKVGSRDWMRSPPTRTLSMHHVSLTLWQEKKNCSMVSVLPQGWRFPRLFLSIKIKIDFIWWWKVCHLCSALSACRATYCSAFQVYEYLLLPQSRVQIQYGFLFRYGYRTASRRRCFLFHARPHVHRNPRSLHAFRSDARAPFAPPVQMPALPPLPTPALPIPLNCVAKEVWHRSY